MQQQLSELQDLKEKNKKMAELLKRMCMFNMNT